MHYELQINTKTLRKTNRLLNFNYNEFYTDKN